MKSRIPSAALLAFAAPPLLLVASAAAQASDPEPDSNILEVTADGPTSFELSAEAIPAGRTTVRLTNASNVVHFAIIEKMPRVDGDQKSVKDSRTDVVPVFQNIMDDINGREPRSPEAGLELPAWYDQVVFLGGPGLTSPGETSEVTLDLEPGTYVIECYVKMADGTFHSTEGMIEGLTVTEAASDASTSPPAADARVSVSFDGGIQMDGALSAGARTVEVTFADQHAHAHFLGHDVHLVRLEDGADLGALGAWMDWTAPGGLAEPAPSGVRFLGGTQDMPGGSSVHLSVALEPGDYAWIAEVPDPAGKNMLVEFSIP